MEKYRGVIGVSILTTVVTLALIGTLVAATRGSSNELQQGPPTGTPPPVVWVWKHKYIGPAHDRQCKEELRPEHAESAWTVGRCPVETDTPTPVTPPPTPEIATATFTPIPSTATNTSTPVPTPTNTPTPTGAPATNTPTATATEESVTSTPTSTPTAQTPTATVTISSTVAVTPTRTLVLALPTSAAVCAVPSVPCEYCCPGEEEYYRAAAEHERALTAEVEARTPLWKALVEALTPDFIQDFLSGLVDGS